MVMACRNRRVIKTDAVKINVSKTMEGKFSKSRMGAGRGRKEYT